MHRIIIIGGGPGGTITANHLAEHLGAELRSGEVQITLLTDQPEQVYKPGFLYLAFGLEAPEHIRRPVRDLVSPYVDVRVERVTKVDTEQRQVMVEGGGSHPFDQLVLASGTRLDPSATPGLAEAGDWFYDEAAAQRLHDKLEALQEGRIVVSVIGVPHMCPVAPLEVTFMLDQWLQQHGRRDKVELAYTYPINRTHSIASLAEWATPELQKRNVHIETFFNAESVDVENKVLQSMEGTELEFDILIAIPEHRSAEYLEASGLTEAGWVPTDRHTLEVVGHEGIWALGDTTNLPVSKAGSVAHYQSAALAKNVAARVHGEAPVARYDGKTICFIEAGLDSATFIEFNYARPPQVQPPTKMIHWAKLAYNNAYWLTAKGAL
jgi:sulfide:quinone oxidoreductase